MEHQGRGSAGRPPFSHVAFLRGMNVGGHRITNADLEAVIGRLGFTEVSTYQASGNVLLDVPPGRAGADVEATLEAGLSADLGYPVPTFVRHHTDVVRIGTTVPFPGHTPSEGGKLQVALLKTAPEPGVVHAVLAMVSDDDALAVEGATLYWQPAGRLSDSDLDLAAIERLVGPMTIRTMGTIQRLQKKLR